MFPRRRSRLAGLLSLFALAACQAPQTGTIALTSELVTPYRLDAGDRLRVIIFGQDDLSNIYTIDSRGEISMPLIGDVPARGRTPDELERQIATSLRGGYLRDPHVSIEVQGHRPFYILGEVRQPGSYSFQPGLNVTRAVALAGGFTERAAQRSAVITRPTDGEVVRFKADPLQPIAPGDTIEVVERLF